MKPMLHHPLWTHSPALACIATNIGLLLSTKLPDRVPTHFSGDGLPDSWGSPLDLWLSLIGWPLFIVLCSAILDESWSRIEQPRRWFNWISLLDECAVGFSVGKTIMIAPQLSKPEPVLQGWWPSALLMAGVAIAFAVFLELQRPYRPVHETQVDVKGMAQNVQHQFLPGGRWFYWETLDSAWSRCLVVLIAVPALVFAGDSAQKSHYGGAVLFAFIAMFLVSFYGGVHIALTPGRLTVRGRFGLPLLRLNLVNAAKVEVTTFSPLLDFGGWGFYRYSFRLRAWGLYLWGGGGVLVQTKNGRRFLIGSKSPDKLAAATEAARIAAALNPNDVKGFDAAVQAIRTDPVSTGTQSSRSGGRFQGLARAVYSLLIILIIAFALYDPDAVRYTITSEGLTIHDLFYSVTIKAADIDIEDIRVVDIGVDPHWRPTEKIHGTSSKRYKAGWFRVGSGEKIRLYQTNGQRLVLLPPKNHNAPVLVEVKPKQPEAFIQEVRQAWR